MTPERWKQVQELFYAAVDLETEPQLALLAACCAGDPDLRKQVEGLLDASGKTNGFIEHRVVEAADEMLAGAEQPAGERVGPYQLIRALASGGMGTVYLATRADDQYRQQVAIKLIRSGLPQRELLLRFRAERQILANLQHDHIARLLDGGVTAAGLPYLVMEYVDGLPIDQYCLDRAVPLEKRLALFRAVCSAVQYAHQNLIVHRDIKPANILVTEAGVPKLLDFGIAKILSPSVGGDTVALTGVAQRLMTPDYASPEQIRGEPITTATDVYSLGVLLYELLTGRRPFQLGSASVIELERVICNQEPAAPSTAVAFALPRDLDNIVMMAMRKEPIRRYASAADLSEDVRLYLAGFPVRARKDTLRYRAGKFIGRNRIGVAAGAILVLVVLGFGIGMGLLARRVALERDSARRERNTAEQVSQFLVSIFQVSDPEKARGDTITAREILDRAATKITKDLRDQPDVEARLLETVGKVYENLGQYETSRSLLEQALNIRRQFGGLQNLDVARSLKDLAELARRKRDFAAAEAMIRESLAIRIRLLGAKDADVGETLNTLALVLHERGDLAAAEPVFRQALRMREQLRTREHAETSVLSNLAGLLKDRGDYAAAEPYMKECVDIRRKTLPPNHPRLALAVSKLGSILFLEEKYAEAEPLLREAMAMKEKVYGPNHSSVADSLDLLGALMRERGDLEEAERMHRRALGIQGNGEFKGCPGCTDTRTLLAMVKVAQRQYPQAEAFFRASLQKIRATLPQGHLALVEPLLGLASLMMETGRAQEAEPLFREAIAVRRQRLPTDHWQIPAAAVALAGCLAAQGRRGEAQALLTGSMGPLEAKRGARSKELRRALESLSQLKAAQG